MEKCTGYVTEVGRSGPQVGRRWAEVGPAQKWAEVCYFWPTSGTGLGSAKGDGERSEPEVGPLLIRYYVVNAIFFHHRLYMFYILLVLYLCCTCTNAQACCRCAQAAAFIRPRKRSRE